MTSTISGRLARRFRPGLAAASAAAILAVPLVAAPAAGADTPDNPWAPFTNCPVDDPGMISNPPSTFGTMCAATSSPTGTFAIGDTVVETGSTIMQFGVYSPTSSDPTVVPATDGKTLQSETVTVPGGLFQLEVPEGLPGPIARLLTRLLSGPPLDVQATVELAGPPSNFNAAGALGSGQPAIHLPVKLHLENALLGGRCYIGSNADPIVLKPTGLTPPTGGSALPEGFSGFIIQLRDMELGDSSFAVPEANGCGPLGLLDGAVNAQLGLPSPAGENALLLKEASLDLAITQAGGQELSDAWHDGMSGDAPTAVTDPMSGTELRRMIG
jgi:hypothetical protein